MFNMIKQEDRRVRYSKMVIKESFIELLEKKPISQITIKELCEKADVNRATFYAHYSDQYDLLEQIENELIDNIRVYLKGDNLLNLGTADVVGKIFEYIKDNARICRLLLSERGDLGFQKQVMTVVYDLMITELTNKNVLIKEDAEYVYSFIITGCIGLIQKWLDSNMKKTPHDMAVMILKLTKGLMR